MRDRKKLDARFSLLSRLIYCKAQNMTPHYVLRNWEICFCLPKSENILYFPVAGAHVSYFPVLGTALPRAALHPSLLLQLTDH